MNALFVNAYGERACGVWQFGVNLYNVLRESEQVHWVYLEPQTAGNLMSVAMGQECDVVLYNWSSIMGGWLQNAPFPWIKKQALVFHDGEASEKFDAVFFADPTAVLTGKWHVIGRPLPTLSSIRYVVHAKNAWPGPIVGCHGFIGAWADEVVKRVMQEFEWATIRLLLPYSAYCDPQGIAAKATAATCRRMVEGKTISLEISHEFLPQEKLLDWLSMNDINCYIRPLNNWRGVSSAPDCALAVKRPLAVNCCSAFRHLHHLKPSIVVDESSLLDILGNGLSPFVDWKKKWCDPEVIREQVENVLLKL